MYSVVLTEKEINFLLSSLPYVISPTKHHIAAGLYRKLKYVHDQKQQDNH